MSKESKFDNSEIVNQKKHFIFNASQTSNYVFPNEYFDYYVYIKNISGDEIKDFVIQIEHSPEIYFQPQEEREHKVFDIKDKEVKLYRFRAFCQMTGEFFVHFIGYGEGTQILYETLKIKCTRTVNSEEVIHKINIYDFSPYEDKYSMEATNYNEKTTQIFKNQKLPYKSKKKPFRLQTDFDPDNIESESYKEQYEEVREYQKNENKNEHVYQYISRENFLKDGKESYEGKNLFEIFKDINEKSEYFKAKFLRTGTNELENNIKEIKPNGFIYRMGLLSSEIFHNIGVVPTYSYMSDYLFRWAPGRNQLLNLIPEKRAMRWDENIWAGRGWFVSRQVTDKYKKTPNYQKEKEKKIIKDEEIINKFESKLTAEEFINKMETRDEVQRRREGTDIIKYEYKLRESIYDTGVFYVNIPIDKIPSNFYLLNNENIYALINRTKPFGTKPIVNYIVERTFNQHMDQELLLNHHKKFLFEMETDDIFDYTISQNEYKMVEEECEGGDKIIYPKFIPKRTISSENFYNNHNMEMFVDYSKIGIKKIFEQELEKEVHSHKTKPDYELKTLKDILELLYQENYNDICFKLEKKEFNALSTIEGDIEFGETNQGIVIKNKNNYPIEALKIRNSNSYRFAKNKTEINFIITDDKNKKHKINLSYDKDMEMDFVKYIYTNSKNEENIRQKGYQEIRGIGVIIKKLYNKKMLIFMVEDNDKILHYFHHVIVQDIQTFSSFKVTENVSEPIDQILFANNLENANIIFEPTFVKKAKTFTPSLILGGEKWNNLYRLNDNENSYSYIKNITPQYLPINDILFCYDNIDIPETSIIKKLRIKTMGKSNSADKIYIKKALNTNYLMKELKGYKIQLSPDKIEAYSNFKESSIYYQNKLDMAREKNQITLIKKYEDLLQENYIFNEDIDVDILDYMKSPNDYITIDNPFWYELSEFTDLTYKLNEIESISFIVEGYNTEYETEILLQTLYGTDNSSIVKNKIPSGYFRKKINLLYPNEFLLAFLRVRFSFNNLGHNIKIFDTKIELNFKNKQENEIEYNYVDDFKIDNSIITVLKDYYNPADINNGLLIKYEFDDLAPGGFYQINTIELEVIYEETDMNIMINDNKYKDIFYDKKVSSISGIVSDAYLSGEFYNDVITMGQPEDNIGIDNKGIRLQKELYQSFETRSDNITSIELFPYSFKGNPSDILKIGLYTNSFNTPGKLIKEVHVSGWVKNNQQLKNLGRIKYNFNVNGLNINERYWFKIEVLNPQENSYYLLKGIDKTKAGFKLLANENNNYINTFSNLKFNIYSKNISKSFNDIPVLQEYFDNPYVLIGLHKSKGSIKGLQINKPD